jgi:hypothetical protein
MICACFFLLSIFSAISARYSAKLSDARFKSEEVRTTVKNSKEHALKLHWCSQSDQGRDDSDADHKAYCSEIKDRQILPELD